MKDLTEGKESKLILRFALPLLLANIFQQLYSVVDSIIVGNFLGKEALAAVGVSFPIIFALMAFVIGIGSGISVVISQYFGAKDRESVKRAVGTTYIFLLVVSIILPLIGIPYSEAIFRFLQLPEEIIPMATSYFNIYIGGSLVFFVFYGTASILRGLGDSKNPLIFVIISTIFNVILDLYFVLGLGLGVKGVAYATVLAQFLTCVFIIIYLNRTHKVVRFSMKMLRFDKKIFRESIRIGLPFGFQQFLVALGMVALWGIVNRFGTDVAAAYAVAGRIDAFAILPSMNFSAAIATFTGQNLGANRLDRVSTGVKATLKMSSLVCIVVAVFVLVFKRYLMGIFTTDVNVIAIGEEYLMVLSASYILFNTMFIFNGVLRGAGATMITLYVTLLALWVVRVPLAYILSLSSLGILGIWLAAPFAWSFGAASSFLYYKFSNWKNKGVVGNL